MVQCQKLPCINQKPPAYEKPRKIWTSINKIRTGNERCSDSLYKWYRTSGARCDYEADRKTVQHIIAKCLNRAYGGDFEDFLVVTREAV